MSSGRSTRAVLKAGEPAFREFLTAVILHGQAAAEAAGLGATDFYALNLLGALGPLTAGELAHRTGLTSGATTRLIDRLEHGGHVHRVADPADRRRVRIKLSADRAARNADTVETGATPPRRGVSARTASKTSRSCSTSLPALPPPSAKPLTTTRGLSTSGARRQFVIQAEGSPR